MCAQVPLLGEGEVATVLDAQAVTAPADTPAAAALFEQPVGEESALLSCVCPSRLFRLILRLRYYDTVYCTCPYNDLIQAALAPIMDLIQAALAPIIDLIPCLLHCTRFI